MKKNALVRRFILLLVLLQSLTEANINVYTSTQYKMDRGVTRYYDLNITQGQINPDCSLKAHPVLLINGQMPGPAIIADQGDMIHITVRNQIEPDHKTQAVAIHFHGIRQYGSNHADGVPFLTQYPVLPGQEYVHNFRVVNQAGTYFYHAHLGLQEETVFGPIVIYESKETRPENLTPEEEMQLEGPVRKLVAGPFEYDHERTLMLSEWWHETRLRMENFIMSDQFTMIPEADSILINGRTLYDPKDIAVPQCAGYDVLMVQPQKIYRLRIIGATAFRTLFFAIAGHKLTIIEVDGELVKPFEVNQLEVTPGQRFSVLLFTHQNAGDFSIEVIRSWSDGVPRETNGLAVLHYYDNGFQSTWIEPPAERADLDEEERPNWVWPELEPLYGVDPVVRRPASRTIKLRTVEARQQNGLTRFFVNGVAFMEQASIQRPLLYDVLSERRKLPDVFARSLTGFDPYLGTYPVAHYEIIDIVIQSTHYPGRPCRSHPWHTHGHSHWEIAYGEGEYDEKKDGNTRNIPRPIQKDVTLIYPAVDDELSYTDDDDGEAVGCGWSKIRLIADNPGIWAVHCHNTFHMVLGMMVVFEEAPELITNNSFIDFQNYPL